MASAGSYPRRAGPRDLLFFQSPHLWQHYPFLPLLRWACNGAEPECGILYDARGVSGTYGFACTAFLVNLFALYNAADYPPEVRGLFAVEWDFPSVEPPSYLMRISPDVYQQEQERVARRFEEAVHLAEQAFVAEFSKLVAHLSERLTGSEDGERKVFRDSAVSNLTECFQRFATLNVRSNAQLDELVEQAQQLVRGLKPQELRDNAGLREVVAAEMAQVQTQLDGLIVERPRRHIIRANPSRNGGNHATAD
jgi:hypothetical protein